MITLAGNPRGIGVIRAELRDVVVPAVSDARALMSLKMIDVVLAQMETMVDHQGAWMHQEIQAIEDLAGDVDPGLTPVAEALVALRAGRATTEHLDDVRAEYYLASELLSVMLEQLVATPGPLQVRAVGLLQQRLDRELTIRGPFELVGQAG